jgi:long-chain acyl-CoA synthetase
MWCVWRPRASGRDEAELNLASLALRHESESRAFHGGHGGGRWWTWGEVRSRARALARTLEGLGARPGERVAIVLPTSPGFAVAYLAVLYLGGIAVPLDVSSPPSERSRYLALASPVAVVEEDLLWEATGGQEEPPASPDDAGFEPVGRSPADPAAALLTSGTGGLPKLALLTHKNLLSNIDQMLSVPGGFLGIAAGKAAANLPSGGASSSHPGASNSLARGVVDPSDVALSALPMSHIFGLNVSLGLSIATGVPLVCVERFDAGAVLEALDRFSVSLLTGAPGMFAAWVGLEEGEGRALSNLRLALSGAGALSPEVSKTFEERFEVPLHQGYGLTEASPAVATTLGEDPASGTPLVDPRARRSGAVGRALPGVSVRLVDFSSGEDVSESGDPGEIWVSGPNVFAGYLGDEGASAEVLAAGGWLRTGDVGMLDENGNLFVVDRLKDVIVVSGFNVYPEEVERVLATAPGVAEAVVLGHPDPLTGEAVAAVVVPDSGGMPDGEQIRRHCREHLASYKCPVEIRVMEGIPKSRTGKAIRHKLAEEAFG